MFDASTIPESWVDASVSAAVIALDKGAPVAARLVRNALKLTSTVLSPGLAETLRILASGEQLATSDVFERGWVCKRTVQRHLVKLEWLGLVRRERGRGRRGDRWVVSAKGVIISRRAP